MTKYIFRSFTLFNALLAALLIFIVQYTFPLFLRTHIGYTVPFQKKTPPVKEVTKAGESPSLSDYIVVAADNLFSPERRIPPEKKDEQQASLPKPDILLYGTLITNDTAVAYVEDLKSPVNTPGRGKRQIRMKEGDILSGFTLKDIETDKIVLMKGEEKLIVSVTDSEKRKAGVASSAPEAKPQTPAKPLLSLPKKPLPKTRAPMSPVEERARAFFAK